MEDVLRELIVQISSLSPPYNPVHIDSFFSKVKSVSLEHMPPPWHEHVRELKTLQALTMASFEITKQFQSRTVLIAQNKQAVFDLQVQMTHISQSLHDAFEIILPLINGSVQAQYLTSQAFATSCDNHTKKALVHDYLSHLLNQPIALNPFTAQLKLYSLRAQVSTLISEINNLGILFSPAAGQDRFVPLLLRTKERVASLMDLISNVSQFKRQVEHKPPNLDFLNKIQSIIRQQEQHHEALETLETEIATHHLEYRIKNRLNDEYLHASFKADLIDSYQQKIYNYTWVNPVALYSRFQNDQFSLQQSEYRDCVSYLNLLNQRHCLQQEEQSLVYKKNILTELITKPCDLHPDDTLNQLLKTVQPYLLSRFPRGAEASHTLVADCYLIALEKIPELESQLLRANQSLKKLEALVIADSELHQVRNQFNLLPINDIHLLDEHVLRKKALEYPLQEEDLLTKSRITLCQNYLTQMKQYDELQERHRIACTLCLDQDVPDPIEQPLNDVLTQIDACISRLKTCPLPRNDMTSIPVPPFAAIDEIKRDESLCLSHEENHDSGATSSEVTMDELVPIDITASSSGGDALAAPIMPYDPTLEYDYQEFQRQLLDNIEADIPLNKCPISSSKTSAIEDILQPWHDKNCVLLQKHPNDLRQWYHDVSIALAGHLQHEPQSHRVVRLVHDILFELQNNKELDVLYAYKRLCPNPSEDIYILLALKPNLPISSHLHEKPTELAPELKPLYDQYITLQKHHPRQAALLLDLIHMFHDVIRQKEACGKRLTLEEFPSFTHDPRYETLMRHRGKLKIWEMIEDLLRLIFGVLKDEPEHLYLKKPCFFKTRSVRLAEDAFQHLASPPHTPQTGFERGAR